MLFLLNDAVLQLETDLVATATAKSKAQSINFDFIARMGQELFSEDPLVYRNRPERAKRLASLIVAKAPTINAALFLAPVQGCAPQQVQLRYAQLSFEVICGLAARQSAGELTPVEADRQVWRRLAA